MQVMKRLRIMKMQQMLCLSDAEKFPSRPCRQPLPSESTSRADNDAGRTVSMRTKEAGTVCVDHRRTVAGRRIW